MRKKYSSKKPKRIPKKNKFKSGLEYRFAQKALKQLLPFSYEPDRFKYIIQSHYTPDFKIRDNVYIETKGYFSSSNRSRLLSFIEQYPQTTIYLVFQKPYNKLNKASDTTYAEWCDKHSIQWGDINKPLPKRWWFPTEEIK